MERLELVIESGIPLYKEKKPTRYGKFKETASKMQVGDSVFVVTLHDRHALLQAISRIGLRGKSRRDGHGYRIWRVANDTNT